MDEFSSVVKAWWAGMCLLAVFNVSVWLYLLRPLNRLAQCESAALTRYRRLQWLFAGLYVVGCASRSVVLRGDVARITLIDHWFASVLVGRSIATIAEIAFVVQWALLALLLGKWVASRPVTVIGWSLVPLIVIAEVFSWWASLTTNHLGNAIEESLWALDAALMVTVFVLCYPRVAKPVKKFLNAGLALAIAYIVFMVSVDIPTYLSRWRASNATGKHYLSLAEGFQDIQFYTVDGSLEAWKYNMVWMTGYFSLAVWISLALVLLPRFGDADRDG